MEKLYLEKKLEDRDVPDGIAHVLRTFTFGAKPKGHWSRC